MFRRLILGGLFAALPLWSGVVHASDAEDLYKLLDRKECRGALATLQSQAAAGDAAFQLQLGLAHYFGKCTVKDERAAADWVGKAATQGNALAQNNFGAMYANGLGVTKDERLAVEWYRKAAEQGNANAQNNLGVMSEAGNGTRQDPVEAVRWYVLAAGQGYALGQRNLAMMLRDGTGIARDPIRAHAWLNLASAADKPYPAAAQERDALADDLTPEQLADAQRLAREWKPGSAMGAPRVKVAAAPLTPKPVAATASDLFPARPNAQPGRTACNTRCNNGSCYRTYDNGRKVQFQAQRKYNAFTSQWDWKSGSC